MTDSMRTRPAAVTVSKGRRTFTWCAIVTVPLIFSLAIFFTLYLRLAPQPPVIALTDLDPDVKEALSAALTKVREAPNSAKDWAHLGQLLRAHSMIEPAGACFARLRDLEPREPRWPHLYGETLLQHNRAAEAIAPLEQAVTLGDRLDPPVFAPRLRLAEALLAAARIDEAGVQMLRAQELEPTHPNIRLGLAQVALARQDDKTAEPFLLRCVDAPSTRQRACALLAGIYLRQGERERADAFSKRAAALPADVGWGDPWVLECSRLAVGKAAKRRLLNQLEVQGRTQEAIELAQQLLEAGPDAALLVSLGRNQFKRGDSEGAEKSLRAAVKLTPGNVQAIHSLCEVLCGQAELAWKRDADKAPALARYREAAALARQAIAAQPDHGTAHLLLGVCLLRQGQRADGIAALRMALACAPEFPEPALYLGIALTEAGQFAEARQLLEYGQRLAPAGEARFAAALQTLNERKQ